MSLIRWATRTTVTLLGGLALLAGATPHAGAADLPPMAGGQPGASRAAVNRRVVAMTALGQALFADPALSASGTQACATCHSPADAFGPPNALAVQRGGADGHQPGLRAVPTLKYLQAAPQFTAHYFDAEDSGDDSVDQGPTGGLTWDGRVDRPRDQARLPLFSPFEMANPSADGILARIRQAPYRDRFRQVFGSAALADPEAAVDAVTEALEAYQQSAAAFYPYSSKYDRYLAGTATLTPQEQRGLAAFNAEDKGNCASCHISTRGVDGTPPQFTDFGYFALAAPRNPTIPANRDPAYHDLGLCGPLRRDLADDPATCGLFRTPTLRNVATRRVFFHNGVFTTLRQVVEFYATRDSNPAKWYPRRHDGSVDAYNDLPVAYRGNVYTDPPFGQHAGDPPRLSEAEIDDIVAFLKTLTDGK